MKPPAPPMKDAAGAEGSRVSKVGSGAAGVPIEGKREGLR